MPKLRNQSIVSAATAAPTAISLSQSLAAAGALLINGALAATVQAFPSGAQSTIANVLNAAGQSQPITITSAGNDSGLTWTISGTGYSGAPISETLAGGNAAAVTSLYNYATITSIKGSGATASTVTAGTGATQYGPWLIVGAQQNEFQTNVRAFIGTTQVPATATYNIQATSDINLMNQAGGYADDIDTLATALTQNVSSYPNAPWHGYRLVVTAGGPVTLRIIENRTA